MKEGGLPLSCSWWKVGSGGPLETLGTFPLIYFTSCPVQLTCFARSLAEVPTGSAPKVSIRREEKRHRGKGGGWEETGKGQGAFYEG